MAAKRLRPDERLLDIRSADQVQVEGYEVHSDAPGEVPERRVLTDAPPDRYVERVAEQNGEVRVAPMVDALLKRLRDQRARPGA
jgi:hypothetical protein